MIDKSVNAQARAHIMKDLREKHKETVDRTQAFLKVQNEIRRRIRQALGDEAKTIPEVTEAAGLPADHVLWHLMAMKKYGQIQEQGMDDQYYRYRLNKEQR
jgi:predicted transcriptional regulator